MDTQRLLKHLPDAEYPAEYLAARLLGKKSTLFKDWNFLIGSTDGIRNLANTRFFPYLKTYGHSGVWRFLSHEHLWVYSRMNPSLRKTFSSYFAYHELSTLFVCLRYLASNRGAEAVLQELHHSLLNQDIRIILTSTTDFTKTLQTLEAFFVSQSDSFRGLYNQYAQKGMGGLEVFVLNCFWTIINTQSQPVVLKEFFQQLVDFYNCISLAKAIRWLIKTEPALFPGGTIPVNLFSRAYFLKDMGTVLKALRLEADFGNKGIEKMENLLLGSISRKLKIKSYQRTIDGILLYYLWEQYRYTRNISMLLNTTVVEETKVREKVVA